MSDDQDFYSDVLKTLLLDGRIDKNWKVLVVAGGKNDAAAFLSHGFKDVTISNLDDRMTGSEFAPYDWAFEDGERLTFADDTFDFAVVHYALHHCRVPHQALAEMYRVSKYGVLFIESRDNVLIKLAIRLGLMNEYEVEAVVGSGYAYGGYRNSQVPNYIYRWTEREVEKIAKSFDPTGELSFKYFYAMRLPVGRLAMRVSSLGPFFLTALAGPADIFAKIFRKQGNLFAAYIGPPSAPWPWLTNGTTFNREWADERFRKWSDTPTGRAEVKSPSQSGDSPR